MTSPTEKSDKIHYPVFPLIADRRSIRAYDSRPVEKEKIHSLFEAVRWAPSSSNEQPWIYLYATAEQPELWNKMFGALEDGNKLWAQHAPLLILALARKTFRRNGKENRYALYDIGGANSFLALQAVHLGLQVRQMAGFKTDVATQNLNIPEDLVPAVFIAVGYPGEIAVLPETLQVRETAPRERILQQEFVRNVTF
ncbi:MAG: nitroreductase family protein [Bacteroidetes bacterium]|nr:nitroreductase family protein [Bacteroidota bacterium]